jgi:hypothetical protein
MGTMNTLQAAALGEARQSALMDVREVMDQVAAIDAKVQSGSDLHVFVQTLKDACFMHPLASEVFPNAADADTSPVRRPMTSVPVLGTGRGLEMTRPGASGILAGGGSARRLVRVGVPDDIGNEYLVEVHSRVRRYLGCFLSFIHLFTYSLILFFFFCSFFRSFIRLFVH